MPSRTRRRVQHVTGEILTEETVLSRLREEEENRKEKRKKQGQGSKTVGNSRPNKRKKAPSVDVMFLETLSGLEQDTSGDIEEHGAIGEVLITDDESEYKDGIEDTLGVVESNNNHHFDARKLEEGVTHVLAMYEGSCFPGLVVKLKKKTVEVSCMGKKGLFGWKLATAPRHP